MEVEQNAFKKKVLDILQLAYKITANSLYGQTGAPTSPIFMKEIAACTTATGREMLKYSKKFVEEIFSQIVNLSIDDRDRYMTFMKDQFNMTKEFNYIPDDKKFSFVFDDCIETETGVVKSSKHGTSTLCKLDAGNFKHWKIAFFRALRKKIISIMTGYHINPKVIYGDTDSVFIDLHIMDDKTGKLQTNKMALEKAISLGVLASMAICMLLPEPMRQEYEKCMYPFMQLSKKRYVGNLYMTDVNKFIHKSMGIVLKRRDNAQIVKIVCGGIVDRLLNKRDPKDAVQFTRDVLRDIMMKKYSIDKFIITKTLRENYKNRK
jgi:DNA polymerase elongation subunit (family B)